MPRDSDMEAPTTDILAEFKKNAERSETIDTGRTTVLETAQTQIELDQRKSDSLSEHDLKWDIERDRLANHTNLYPSMDLGAQPERNINEEYQMRRNQWEQGRSEIQSHFDHKVDEVRDQGLTLTSEFNSDRESSEPGQDINIAFSNASGANGMTR